LRLIFLVLHVAGHWLRYNGVARRRSRIALLRDGRQCGACDGERQ
jgi:hypothetical protein